MYTYYVCVAHTIIFILRTQRTTFRYEAEAADPRHTLVHNSDAPECTQGLYTPIASPYTTQKLDDDLLNRRAGEP